MVTAQLLLEGVRICAEFDESDSKDVASFKGFVGAIIQLGEATEQLKAKPLA